MKTLRNSILLVAVLFIASTVGGIAQQIMICNTEGCNPAVPAGACWPAGAQLLPGVNSAISGGILPGSFILNTQCRGIFDITDPGDPGCCFREFEPHCQGEDNTSCWNCFGNDATLGQFNWWIACPNRCPRSTLTPLVAGQCFPAQVDIYFNVEGTIAMFPGMIFHSSQCIHLQGIVNSCNPFRCEVFTLVNGPIQFFDQNGGYAFDLDCLVMVLNG